MHSNDRAENAQTCPCDHSDHVCCTADSLNTHTPHESHTVIPCALGPSHSAAVSPETSSSRFVSQAHVTDTGAHSENSDSITQKTQPSIITPIIFADQTVKRTRRRADLVDFFGALLGIILVWTLGAYANSTTRGVTEDVLQFKIIRDVLLLPVTFLEGLVILVAPIVVITSLVLRRRLWGTVATLLTSGVAAVLGWAFLEVTNFLPDQLTAPLRVSTGLINEEGVTSTTVAINIVVVILASFLTAAGETTTMRSVRWSWWGLWAISFLWVVRLSLTLPSALISLLLGRAVGSASRWILGCEDRRATGPQLVHALRSIGISPLRLIRCDVETDEVPLCAWSIVPGRNGQLRQFPLDMPDTEYVVPRQWHHDKNRHYRVWDENGNVCDVISCDPGREFTGTVRQIWDNLRLRGVTRWVAPSLKASAERSMLATLAAYHAGVRLPEPVGIVPAGDSVLLINHVLPATLPLREMSEQTISSHILDEAWRQLACAHQAGIAHRNVSGDSIVVDAAARVWLIDWEQGEAGASDLTMRIDVAQLLVSLSLVAGVESALASAQRVIGPDELRACAPFLQRAVLPSQLSAAVRQSTILEDLRDAIVADASSPAVNELANIQRFAPRSVIMVAVILLATIGIVSSLNIGDIIEIVRSAHPLWIGVACACAVLTWFGGALALVALTAEKVRIRDAFLAQIAASLVTLVAPAGIGPAAVNIRYLTKQKVPAAAAMTTATMQQIVQLLVTVGMLVILAFFSGQRLSVSLPYGAIIAISGTILIAVLIIVAIPKLRRWVWQHLEPKWVQVYPRLLWVMGRPQRLFTVVAGNLLTVCGFITCFISCTLAMGWSLDPVTASITYLASNSLGSVIPSPGGIGPVEAALTGGLQVTGVPLSAAISIALLYRLVTFYGRAPIGWVAMKIMEKKNLI
ncbi:lysylphosphatidylglycerol synthase transmembrane domain-containing protein [Schaalia sp. lx-100]|uniref:lysylphosphatidylglycerol synthase transmembrane domain-containing protein n=1 Tax=Schaalia sp. lx-100 TaxID=2899081 RepID=UPI001E45C284|nr:flippase-like domain-containing protein [Schaalia sp. lx-100]